MYNDICLPLYEKYIKIILMYNYEENRMDKCIKVQKNDLYKIISNDKILEFI
jgi:hypothetical protein